METEKSTIGRQTTYCKAKLTLRGPRHLRSQANEPPLAFGGFEAVQWFGVAFLLQRDPGLCTAPATGTRGEQRPLRGPQGEAWFPVRGFLEGAPVVRHIEKSFKSKRFSLQTSGLSCGLQVFLVFQKFREGFRGFDSVHHFLKRISGMRYLGTNGVSLSSKRCRVVWSTRTWMACCCRKRTVLNFWL